MSEWKEYKLGELIKTNVRTLGKNYPYSRILYLDTGSIVCNAIDSFQEFDIEKAPSRAKRLVVADDIIYSSVRPNQLHYGFIKDPQDNLIVSTGFVTISCNKDLLYPKFLYYYIIQPHITEYLHSVAEASTSAYPSLKPSDIEALEINLPPLEEQKRIASILSSLDDKIDLLHRENATLEAMAETLFRQWFIEEAKEDWEEGKLGDFVSVIDNRGKTPPYTDNITEYPIIEVNALTGAERYVKYNLVKKYVEKEIYDSWFRGYFHKYDVFVSTVGSIGELAMCLEERGVIAQNVVALHANNISPFYLYQYLMYNKDDLKGLDIGSVQPSIKVPHLLNIPIPIPPKDVLLKYDNYMVNVVEKLLYNVSQIKIISQLRDNLLNKLMSNEIDIE